MDHHMWNSGTFVLFVQKYDNAEPPLPDSQENGFKQVESAATNGEESQGLQLTGERLGADHFLVLESDPAKSNALSEFEQHLMKWNGSFKSLSWLSCLKTSPCSFFFIFNQRVLYGKWTLFAATTVQQYPGTFLNFLVNARDIDYCVVKIAM